jgi:hypothetical protein
MKKPATSPTGWWIAGLLEKQPETAPSPYWNNYRLVRADDWRTAFRRAMEMGASDARTGNRAFTGLRAFIGVCDLIPIFDKFEDGAELLWQELEASEDDDGIPLQVFTEDDFESQYEEPGEQGAPSNGG